MILFSCNSDSDAEILPEEESSNSAAADYPQSGLNGMLGFAARAYSETGALKERTTGGTDGSVVYIHSLSSLEQYIGDATPRILVIAADITATSKTRVYMGSNKSIIGSFSAKTLHNIYLAANSATGNIIFQNLILSHGADINDNDDIQLYLNYGSNYWIDHVTFTGHDYDPNGSDIDKLLYIGAKADYTTISNSKFMNHRYGLILGYPDDGEEYVAEYDGYPHLSIFNNYFENVYTRAPGLMRYGYFHVKNNYVNNFHLAFTIAQNAKIYASGNYFGEGAQYGGILDDKSTGSFIDVNNYPAITNQSSLVTTWNPSINYSGYNDEDPEYARTFAINWAGAQDSSANMAFGY
ncbi:MAG: hypothetical protein LUD15_10145 [Bacteroides sp.]|nr:hypothetical protein [Bacteroides sp.]